MAKDTIPPLYTEEDNDIDEPTYQEDMIHIKNTLNTILENTSSQNTKSPHDSNEFIEYSAVIFSCILLSVILNIMINLAINTK